MKKATKQLIIILCALVIAGGGLAALLLLGGQPQAETTPSSAIMLGRSLTPAELSFSNGKETYNFIFSDGEWSYADEDDFPLNPKNLDNIMTELSTLTADSSFEIADTPEAYGFTESCMSVSVRSAYGNTFSLLFGGNAPDGSRYMMEEGGSTVYTLSSTALTDCLGKDLYDMLVLDSCVQSLREYLKSFSVTCGDVTITFSQDSERKEYAIGDTDINGDTVTEEGKMYTEYTWYMESENGRVLLDTESTEEGSIGAIWNDVMRCFEFYYFAECIDHKADEALLKECGLLPPVLTVKSSFVKDGEDREYTLHFGIQAKGIYRYGQEEGSSALNTIRSEYYLPLQELFDLITDAK